MTFSTVPFALQNAAHTAPLFRQAVASLVPAGGGLVTLGDLAVTQTGTASMAVVIGVGRVWIPGTQVSNVSGGNFSTQAMYFAENEAPVTVGITASDITNPRIDVIYVAVQDSQYSGASDQVSPVFVATGTPTSGASYPTNAPAIPNNAIALAYVSVLANATSIVTAKIFTLQPPVIGAVGATPYTPTITASTSPSLGTGSQRLGQYQIIGKTMFVQFFIAWGTGGTVGSGSYLIGLPPGFNYAGVGSAPPLGVARGHFSAGDISGFLTLSSANASTMVAYWQSTTTAQSAFNALTWNWASGGYVTGTATLFLA